MLLQQKVGNRRSAAGLAVGVEQDASVVRSVMFGFLCVGVFGEGDGKPDV